MELEREYLELNAIRIKLRNTYIILTLIIIGGIATVFILTQQIFTIFIGIFVAIILTLIFTAKPEKDYSKKYKNYFVAKSLEQKLTDLSYNPEQGIGYDVIANTNMMRMGDTYSSNDLISGKYKDTAFMQSDVHIEEEHESTDSDGNTTTYYVTIFKGRWMVFEFNKNFKANLQVCQKGFGNNIKGGIFSKSKLQKIELESAEFNKRFNVYAEQPHEAFYILTPKTMEKIINLDNRNNGKILLCFVNNCLHVGIYDNKDAFEHPSVFKKIDLEKEKQAISNDIEKITMFIDELELDNDLFKIN